jgi:ubiquinone/menaquinone biosynthesis C-methylase UbiE
MTMSIDDTRSAYDLYPDYEWNRFETGAQHRLEYLVTHHALGRHLPRASPALRLLDAGGGPGRYTMALAEQGYRVTLLDLSPRLLEIARTKIDALPASTQERIEATIQGSITDLTQFPDAGFDATLCLGGPLSHLVEQSDRQQALSELRRVTKPGGLLFVSVMGRIGQYRSAVQWPDWFDGVFPEIAETGTTTITPGRAPCHFFLPEELSGELIQAGFEVDHFYGCQGIGAHLDEVNLLALMNDPVRWPQWRRELLATCDHPAVIGVANHILAVTRRPSRHVHSSAEE